VVRYGSRIQVLLDMALSIAHGDYDRSWAWTQLGLWRVGAQPSAREAVRAFVRALADEPQHIVPLLRVLAMRKQLGFFTARLAEEQWVELAQAALLTVGAPTSLLDAREPLEPAPLTTAPLRRAAHRLLDASLLREELMSLATVSPIARRVAAILMVLDADPNALRTVEESGRALLDTVGEALEIFAVVARTKAEPKPIVEVSGATSKTSEDGATVLRRVAESSPEAESGTKDGNTVARRSGEAQRALSHDTERRPEEPVADADGGALLPSVRREAPTRFGGLLFLLGVLDDLGVPDDIRSHPAFTGRLSGWVLHQLALALVPAEENDPAVLAFAGLPPDAVPPSHEEEPITEAEQRAIASYAARLRKAVRDRLDRRDPEEALQFVCYRQATIVADPGWVEVHFALVDLSTEIRRAALDLNPDYLPWLGVVVKFVYD
jgi:hypothetical protein